MNKLKRTIAIAAVAVSLSLGESRAQDANSEARLDSLVLANRITDRGDPFELEKEPTRDKRAKALYELWLVHLNRDVTTQVVPFLQDESVVLRQNAAVILGRMESREAEAELQKLLAYKQRGETGKGVDSEPLQLALARNRTRGLKGEAKVVAFARTNGLSLDEMVRLTQKVYRLRGGANGGTGQKIVLELIDMLYTMAKKGEDIQPLVKRFTLYPMQQLLLEGANLPPEQEAKRLVDYLDQCDVLTPYDGEVIDFYMPLLGVYTTEAAVKRLGEAKEGRVQLGRMSQIGLVNALMWNRDPRAPALLQPLKQSADPWIRFFADLMSKQALLRENESSPLGSIPPTMRLIAEL